MQASELATTAAVVGRETNALEAARLIVADHAGGVVVTDQNGKPASLLAAVDVMRLMVPNYILDDPSLALVFDEQGAEELVAQAENRTIGELLDDKGVRVFELLAVDADATIIELAAQMAEAHTQIALIKGSGPDSGSDYSFVRLPAVMEAVLRFCKTKGAPPSSAAGDPAALGNPEAGA